MINTLSAAQLRKAADLREKIDKLQNELDGLLSVAAGHNERLKKGAGVGLARVRAVAARTAKKRRFSAATRAKMAARAKARWVKAKAAGKSTL